MNEKKESMYSLKEIAGCEGADRHLNLPQIQRGLVWKAAQIELLWDSILRGFPIGSFVVAEFSDNDGENSLQLLDGQQRMNAIKLGYFQFKEKADELGPPILWFDLAPKKNNTRKYWARLCTPAHPWGYKANDKCEVLNTATKRGACEEYGASDTYKPNVFETWPHDAECPIPFVYLIHAAGTSVSQNDFIDEVMKQIEGGTQFKISKKWHSKIGKAVRENLERKKEDLYETFKRIDHYRVSTVALPEGFLKEKTEEEQLGSMECFFERMNTGGTRISSEDLFYSTVKANFKELNLKEHCDGLAEKVMPPSHLAILSFRLALTERGGNEKLEKLHGRPDLGAIRKIARKTDGDDYKAIDCMWKDSGAQIKQCLDTVLGWISYDQTPDGLPPVLRLSLILHSPDVFLLLLWLAKKDGEMDGKVVLQLATILHWLATDKHNACNAIIAECAQKGVSEEAIQRGISFAISKSYLLVPYSPDVLKEEARWKWSENWDWWNAWGEETPYYWDWINQIKENGLKSGSTGNELVLYSQRKYLDRKFKGYNPADPILFGESNRPWDMDHIIPKSWVVGAQGKKRTPWLGLCEKWANSIGNLAAIPFEINRSKNDSDDWDEYEDGENKKGLLYERHTIEENIRDSGDMATEFASWTKDRMIRIYENWFDGLGLDHLLNFEDDNLPKPIRLRKELFERIKEGLGDDANIFFVHGDCGYQVTTNSQHCTDWLTVGVPVGKCMPCITVGAFGDDGQVELEFGIRKAPGEKQLDEKYENQILDQLASDDESMKRDVWGWWYLYQGERVSLDQVDVDELIPKIKAYIEAVKGSHQRRK